MKQITSTELHTIKVRELGLDPEALDLTSTESLAAAIRRAASLLCPASSRTLMRAVSDPLRGLVPDICRLEEQIGEVLEAMLSYGDLIECATELQGNRPVRYLLHTAAPSFVPRSNGAALLIGVLNDLSVFPAELALRIEYVNHVRRLAPQLGENLFEVLIDYGMLELSSDAWCHEPTQLTPSQFINQLDDELNGMASARDIPGLLLLDPVTPVNYYRGRWIPPKRHTGRFVARRSRDYGSDLWCYVQMQSGRPERMIDFPIFDTDARGCDEAWRAQTAIDAMRAQPQRFLIRKAVDQRWIMEFFSPLPMWARRRWDVIAEPIATSGCLFAYSIASAELEEERLFLRESLWLSEKT